ncbi:FAD-dependent monooxygenase terD [Fusarium oxysporum f. sp. albedinis]|nr:FAD-dependent monooxygenase terD [Fusarium oxysporum f. sp. albedinis]
MQLHCILLSQQYLISGANHRGEFFNHNETGSKCAQIHVLLFSHLYEPVVKLLSLCKKTQRRAHSTGLGDP